MKDDNAAKLLASVMGWSKIEEVTERVADLQLLAEHKYDSYQRFAPGKRFIESLALWLDQFEVQHREAAFELVFKHIVFFSEKELSHLVRDAYPDIVVPELTKIVAEENGISPHLVKKINESKRFHQLKIKSLYLGLSDGARTNEFRRSSSGEISNEQIWQAYELSDAKAEDMVEDLQKRLQSQGFPGDKQRFTLIWLLDDFSASGNTYIRYDHEKKVFKGKIPKIYKRLDEGDLVDTEHYELYLLLLVGTRQAIQHITYWAERFAFENNYKPLNINVLYVIEDRYRLDRQGAKMKDLLEIVKNNNSYYDERASDKHIRVGNTEDAKLGFANCCLPVILYHNTPNNSIYILWGDEEFSFSGLFPRVSRHKEF